VQQDPARTSVRRRDVDLGNVGVEGRGASIAEADRTRAEKSAGTGIDMVMFGQL
jgi:hypothetical protein